MTRRRRSVMLGAVFLVALMVFWGWQKRSSAFIGTSRSAPAAPSSQAPMVTVTRSDITPVLTLDASLSAQPAFTVSTLRPGLVQDGPTKPGGRASAGSWLYSLDHVRVPAPADCVIKKWLVAGSQAAAGLPVVDCTYPGFGLKAQVPPDSAYRILSGQLTGMGQINNGPGPFACPILIAPAVSDTTAGALVVCAVPPTVRGIDGVGGLLAVHSRLVSNTLVLPKTAVQGAADSGIVGLLDRGVVTPRRVRLGVTDGNLVQIKGGLAEGDRVTVNAPSLANL